MASIYEELPFDWYVATISPAQEERARINLTRLGITNWLPKYSKLAKQRGITRFVERMLLPGYVFVAFDKGGEQWLTLRDVPGVIGVVAAEGRPIPVPSTIVGTLMSGCLTGFYDLDQRRIGSKVSFQTSNISKAGKPIRMVGRIVSAAEDDRMTVLLSMAGPATFYNMPLDALEVAA